MNAFGVIAIIVLILLGMFFLSSKESQDNVIKKSPDFFKPILEMIKGINDKDEVNYTKVDLKCTVDDQCDKFFYECINRGGCKCKEGDCYIQNLPA